MHRNTNWSVSLFFKFGGFSVVLLQLQLQMSRFILHNWGI